jgi:hypothetical protein
MEACRQDYLDEVRKQWRSFVNKVIMFGFHEQWGISELLEEQKLSKTDL